MCINYVMLFYIYASIYQLHIIMSSKRERSPSLVISTVDDATWIHCTMTNCLSHISQTVLHDDKTGTKEAVNEILDANNVLFNKNRNEEQEQTTILNLVERYSAAKLNVSDNVPWFNEEDYVFRLTSKLIDAFVEHYKKEPRGLYQFRQLQKIN